MLTIEGLYAGYGGSTVLSDVTLHAAPGTVHAVIGANGAGKTTLVHTIAGLIRPTRGRIHLYGRDITHVPAHHRARAGIALVPQGRRVFASLTVAEHLTIAAARPPDHTTGRWDRPTVLELLPQLATRLRHRGAQLSGGEQQMLAIARALLTQPRLLLLDEPTEGLAPALATHIRALITTLAAGGLSILLTAPQPEPHPAAPGRITVLTGTHPTPPPGAGGGDTPTTTAQEPPGKQPSPAWSGLLPTPAPPARSPP